MSQNFKLKFDEMQESNPANASDNNTAENDFYDTPGHARNLCFAWPDGKMKFLNYAYLIYAELLPTESVINMKFTTHKVSIHGANLDKLYEKLLEHRARYIICFTDRYKCLNNENATLIHEIIISEAN